ncbi:MAG: rfaE bifunctional protein nucleotidyltransferase chain/domain [Saprospiraceae bacterium]|jgi:rfaE bifunctional protein nucleotidyltransferase chain/domain
MKSDHAKKILAQPSDLISWLKQTARPLVFTNGCFDLLHRGHITYLEEAAALGDRLIVALNSDDSVRRLNKGPERPLNSLEDRMAVIAALHCVDAVCSFDTDTPLDLITQICPDHLVKGGDWPVEAIVGYELVTAQGGQTHSLTFKHPNSTTKLVNKILTSG